MNVWRQRWGGSILTTRCFMTRFFKYQTKPKLTQQGEIYYEGMENDVTLKRKRPGQLSQAVKDALGMPDNAPPPWLINMQRYGPPPSYPSMKIPVSHAAVWTA